MNPDIELAKKIIERIRRQPGWEEGHRFIRFGKHSIGYYDTTEKSSYFALKFEGIEFNPRDDNRYELVVNKDLRLCNFNLAEWLKRLDEITTNDAPEEVIFCGHKYVLQE